MTRWLLILVVTAMIAVAGVYGAGSALPESLVTVRVAKYHTPMEKLWVAISDYQSLPAWNSHVRTARQVPNPENDHPLWHLEDSNGNHMMVEVLASVTHVLHHAQLVENDLPFTGVWEFEFGGGAEDGVTLVKLRETSKITNPFVRFIRYYVAGIDMGMRVYLQDLGEHFGEKIVINEVLL